MKKLCKRMVFVIALSLSVIGCIDNDYDIDDLDKNAVFKVPPVLLGNVDTIWIDLLPDGFPPISLPIEGEQITKTENIIGIFTDDIVDKFFNEKATANTTLQAKVDVLITESENLNIDIYANVINQDGSVNENVIIDKQSLVNGTEQKLSLVFKKEDFAYMKDASNLRLTIVMTAKSITLSEGDYVYMKSAVLKSGGLHFEF